MKYLPLLAAVPLLLSSCASVSVRNLRQDSSRPPEKIPAKIYVRDFSASDGVFRVNRQGEELKTQQKEFTSAVTTRLVERITKYVAPAQPAPVRLPRESAWLVTGRFDRVNQGSRALRAVIGWGAGGTKLETTVEVFDLSAPKPKRILSFETTGGSNAQPGLLTSPNFFGAPLAGINQATSTGLTRDANRTSRMITAVLCEYLASHKLTEPAIRSKPLGKLPPQKIF